MSGAKDATPTIGTAPRSDVLSQQATLRWDVELTIPDSYSSDVNYQLELAWKNVPIGGYFSVHCTGNINFDIPGTQILKSDDSVDSASYSGMSLPYRTIATVYWRQEGQEKLRFPDTDDVKVSFIMWIVGDGPCRHRERVGEAKREHSE